MKQQLRKRITEEFELRGTARNTRLTYLRCIERFERHMVKGAAGLGREAVREFLLHLVEQGLSPSSAAGSREGETEEPKVRRRTGGESCHPSVGLELSRCCCHASSYVRLSCGRLHRAAAGRSS